MQEAYRFGQKRVRTWLLMNDFSFYCSCTSFYEELIIFMIINNLIIMPLYELVWYCS